MHYYATINSHKTKQRKIKQRFKTEVADLKYKGKLLHNWSAATKNAQSPFSFKHILGTDNNRLFGNLKGLLVW